MDTLIAKIVLRLLSQLSSALQAVKVSNVIEMNFRYNLDDLERVTYIAVRGEVINIERKSTTTSVIVQEGSSNVPYPLDSDLIEFGTAIDDGDLNRALDYLESLPKNHQGAATMWKSLAKISLERENAIHIAIHAAIGDFAKVLQNLNKVLN